MTEYEQNIEVMKDLRNRLDAVINKETPVEEQTYPDAKKHMYISFIKSGLRIVAFSFLAYYEIQTAAVLLLLAELLGVYEEMV